ncbi:hypothetical protein OESDEN_00296 [Oesophagostomum dentatum]|uniref:Uncharacterized protein n=1 Tax=Oesophagostomum dentatum TaxID=61180 RepID=A0A0B1TR28_OESDE|nr:hypothetical protein OESDEN_00296 [Oesophagostomum dentatum]
MVAVFVAVAVVIASLVLNIIILTRVSNINNNIPNNGSTPTPQPTVDNGTTFCPNVGTASTSPAYKMGAYHSFDILEKQS